MINKDKKFFLRDSIIKQIYKLALTNKKIFFLSADFGAPALDIFRKKLPNQFIHMGISEQNMVDVAIGLSIKKNIVINYAMAPFIIARAWEQHKISSTMNLPMINLVAGVGYGYANAGPTHYSNEDLGLANLIVNSNIYTLSDSILASKIASYLIKSKKINFVRIDRDPLVNLNHLPKTKDIKNGYRILSNGNKLCIVSHGYILNKLYFIIKKNNKLKDKITLIDLFRSKPISKNLIKIFKKYKQIITFDEQFENFNLSTLLIKFLNKNLIKSRLHEISLKEKIEYGNDGREKILERNNMSSKKIFSILFKFTKS